MIGGFLILCSLVLAFYEKPHLFKKPIKIGKIIVLAMLLGTAIFSFVQDHNNNVQQESDSAKIDSLTGASNTLINIVNSLRKENKAANQEYVDSIVNYHHHTTELLAGYGIKVDTLNNTVKKIDDKVLKEIPPTLSIVDKPYIDSMKTERVMEYVLTAYNSNAHMISCTYTIVNYHLLDEKTGIVRMDTPISFEGSMNYTTIIATDRPHGMSFFIDRNKSIRRMTDSCFIAIEFVYKSKENKRQTPLRKIYQIDLKNNYVHDVDNRLFTDISHWLKKHEVWPIFYDL